MVLTPGDASVLAKRQLGFAVVYLASQVERRLQGLRAHDRRLAEFPFSNQQNAIISTDVSQSLDITIATNFNVAIVAKDLRRSVGFRAPSELTADSPIRLRLPRLVRALGKQLAASRDRSRLAAPFRHLNDRPWPIRSRRTIRCH